MDKFKAGLFVILSFLSCASFAANEKKDPKELVFLLVEYPPYQFTDTSKKYTTAEKKEYKNIMGMDVDLVREIITEMGYKFKPSFKPWNRYRAFIEKGEVDGTFSFSSYPEYSEIMYRSEPINTGANSLFKRKGEFEKFGKSFNFDDLKGAVLGVGPDSYGSCQAVETAYQAGIFKAKHPTNTENPEDIMLKMLTKKRIDVAEIEYLVGAWKIKNDPALKNIDSFDVLYGVYDFFFGISKKRPDGAELVKTFNAILAEYKKNGKFDKIHEKYGLKAPVKHCERGEIYCYNPGICKGEAAECQTISSEPICKKQAGCHWATE